MGRRQFTAEFKTKIVLEILREVKTIGELAAETNLSPNQLRNRTCQSVISSTRFIFTSKAWVDFGNERGRVDRQAGFRSGINFVLTVL